MKMTEHLVSMLHLSKLENLDPVSVFLEENGQYGRVTFVCFGDAWSASFGNIGEGNDLMSFLRGCNADYITRKFGIPKMVTDFDAINEKYGVSVTNHFEMGLNWENPKLDDFEPSETPMRISDDFDYARRIVSAFLEAIKE